MAQLDGELNVVLTDLHDRARHAAGRQTETDSRPAPSQIAQRRPRTAPSARLASFANSLWNNDGDRGRSHHDHPAARRLADQDIIAQVPREEVH